MFITYTINNRCETHAAFSRTLAFLWTFAAEGESVIVQGYEVGA